MIENSTEMTSARPIDDETLRREYEYLIRILRNPHVETKHDKIWSAYFILVHAAHDEKATKEDLGIAIEEAIGFLGEVLDD